VLAVDAAMKNPNFDIKPPTVEYVSYGPSFEAPLCIICVGLVLIIVSMVFY
jgi:hypothetical protein